MLQLARRGCLRVDGAVDIATLFTDLREVANPPARNDRHRTRLPHADVDVRRPSVGIEIELGSESPAQLAEHPADARIIELARYRRIDRDVLISRLESDVISFPLLAYVTQRIFGAPLVVLVKHN